MSFLKSLGGSVYVQIWKDRIKAQNFANGEVFDEMPLVAVGVNKKGVNVIHAIGNSASLIDDYNIQIINPFSHKRVLLADFVIAEKLLQQILLTLTSSQLFGARPLVVIHPMEKTEGGLTVIERRVFREMAIGAGARNAAVYQGTPLTKELFNFSSIKQDDEM